MTVDIKENFQGSLLGTFVGDALGMPVEGWSPDTIAKHYGPVREMLEDRLGKGTYTDDTQMMIAVTESLVRCEGFDRLHGSFLSGNQAGGFGNLSRVPA